MRRRESTQLAVILAASVLGLDLLWAEVGGDTGHFAYALIDLPAHAATCAVALIALAVARRVTLAKAFVLAALVASVAIDLDHVPGYLGSHVFGGNLPRPDTHGLLPIVFFAGLGAVPSRLRPIALGIAFGLAAHLLRDLATGPGVPIAWPISSGVATLPYAAYAGLLAAAALLPLAVARPVRWGLRPGFVFVFVLGLAIASSPPPAHAAHGGRIGLGAYIKGADRDPSEIEAFAEQVGRNPVIVSIYKDWEEGSVFQPEELTGIWERGAAPMVTWEPWDGDEVGAPLWAIADGWYDDYVAAEARRAAAWGQPIFVRFAHEMNGNWYPWGWGIDGNTPATFKAAWRHVVEIFRANGATNVRWVWCPYANNTHLHQFKRFYPGDQWVDWACLDGFNWGSHAVWQSFKQIFAKPYGQVARVSSRPIMLGEVGVAESGGDKARWILRSFGRSLPRYRRVRALVWFDSEDERANFRVDSSLASLDAIRRVFGGQLFNTSRDALLRTPARLAAPRRHRHRHRHRPSRRS